MKKLLLALPLLGILASCKKSEYPPQKINLSGRGYQEVINSPDVTVILHQRLDFVTGQYVKLSTFNVSKATGDTTHFTFIRAFTYSNFADSNLVVLKDYNLPPNGFSQYEFLLKGSELIQVGGPQRLAIMEGQAFTRYK